MEEAQKPVAAQRRAVAGGALVAVAGLLAALALVYTNAAGVADVADDARHQQQTESALGAAASARNAIGQALLLAGSTNDEVLTGAAVTDARAVLDAMADRVETVAASLPEGQVDLEDRLTTALSDASAILDSVSEGDLQLAGQLATGALAESFTGLSQALAARRDFLATEIARAAAESGTVATASRFMVAFFVPSLAIIIAFVVVRRRRKRERLANELAQQRALNKSKDQLIANLSHELRTPLTGIYTSALTIDEAGYSDPTLARELISVIIDESADLTRMVEDLLVTAQADGGRLSFDIAPTDVEPLVSGLIKEFERGDVPLDVRVEPGVALVDASRLRQVLRNLISNAVRYGEGQIGVKGRCEETAYAIDVIDNGPGVSSQVEERMFERFVHRGDRPLIVGSVGLGLAISKMLAEGMGGEIAYERADQFTVFTVTIPLAATESSNPASHTPTLQEARTPGSERHTTH